MTTNQTTVVCRSFSFDTDDISQGVYTTNYRVMADGGGFRNAEVKITVVCSLEMVDHEKKFEITYHSLEGLVNIFDAYNFFAGGAACPLEYTLKK